MLFKSELVLRGFIHVMFGMPCNWHNAERSWFGRLPYMTLSIMFALLNWFCFGYIMYTAKVHWRGSEKPREPTDALVLMILLFFSGSCTYTLALHYFYNPKNTFTGSSTRLIPKIEFKPDGNQNVGLGPSGKDWLYMTTFLFLGTVVVVMMCFGAFYFDAFFNFYGLHHFAIERLPTVERTIYYANVVILYWSLGAGVALCCVFYMLCRDVIRHIEFMETLILQNARNFCQARNYYETLLHYTDKLIASLKLWFTIHTLFFAIIVLGTVVDWISSLESSAIDFKHIWFSQTAGSLLIAFKFSFPFFAASRVSARFDKMYQVLNRELAATTFPESDEFLSYCRRCKAGFSLLGIRITINLAVISFISCFLGFFKFYKQIL